jgi:hypothetical protein
VLYLARAQLRRDRRPSVGTRARAGNKRSKRARCTSTDASPHRDAAITYTPGLTRPTSVAFVAVKGCGGIHVRRGRPAFEVHPGVRLMAEQRGRLHSVQFAVGNSANHWPVSRRSDRLAFPRAGSRQIRGTSEGCRRPAANEPDVRRRSPCQAAGQAWMLYDIQTERVTPPTWAATSSSPPPSWCKPHRRLRGGHDHVSDYSDDGRAQTRG